MNETSAQVKRRMLSIATLTILAGNLISHPLSVADAGDWQKHVIHEGHRTHTAIGADFTGDGKTDVIASSSGKTRLFIGPEWRELILDEEPNRDSIHSEVMDVDGDGDLDWIGAQYQPGHIFWLEQPDKPLEQKWRYHLISDELIGIHGLQRGDVNNDGTVDLLATSAQPKGRYPDSLAWLKIPSDPYAKWKVNIFANKDAPGLSHYLGVWRYQRRRST